MSAVAGRTDESPVDGVIYLDYAASTPIDPAVAEAMQGCLLSPEGAASASAQHTLGRAAALRIERARTQVAALIGADDAEIYFTSGATESNNLALLGVARANAYRGRHLVTSRIEHKAVLDPVRALERQGFEVSYVAPDPAGRIAPEAVASALRADTVLVSIMHVNNETGVVQDIGGIGALCRARGVPLHSDAAQSAGRIALDARALPVDLLSLSAHKMYGPLGIGALYVRRSARSLLSPILFGGSQERGLRPGTPATHQIAGFGAACDLAGRHARAEAVIAQGLTERLWQRLTELGGVQLNGDSATRVPQILNVSFEDVQGESLLAALADLAVSRGSACNSASAEPSYVLRALGRSARLAESSLRFSIGRFTSESDIERAADRVCEAVRRLRSVGPRAERWAALTPTVRLPSAADAAAQHRSGTVSPEVARWFDELPGAGTLEPSGAVLTGEAGGPDAESWVRFHLLVSGDYVKDARFQAFGCPHTLATAAWVTRQLPGRARAAVVPSEPTAWARALGVPVEKLGRLLTIEDALRAAALRWS